MTQSELILSSQVIKFHLRVCLKLFRKGRLKCDIKSAVPRITSFIKRLEFFVEILRHIHSNISLNNESKVKENSITLAGLSFCITFSMNI